MDKKIAKSTSKGQITLPKKWRSQFKTDTYSLDMKGQKLVITPVYIKKTAGETVLFDADRDNDGKGVGLDTMISMLKNMKHG